jgi:hypothetical protein
LYANGTSDLASGSLLTNANIFYADGGGPLVATDADSWMFNGQMCELYLNTTQYLNDPTNFASGGKPISLGSNGELPTGTAPIVYLRSPYTSFNTNSGTGGNFIIEAPLSQGTPP